MKLLLDECVPRKLKFFFIDAGHECETVTDAGFKGKKMESYSRSPINSSMF